MQINGYNSKFKQLFPNENLCNFFNPPQWFYFSIERERDSYMKTLSGFPHLNCYCFPFRLFICLKMLRSLFPFITKNGLTNNNNNIIIARKTKLKQNLRHDAFVSQSKKHCTEAFAAAVAG